MPDRILRANILTSERLASVSEGAELLYYKLLSLVDDYGRYDGRPRVIWRQAYVLREIPEGVVLDRIDELLGVGAIQIYLTEGGSPILQVARWREKFRAKSSRFADPQRGCAYVKSCKHMSAIANTLTDSKDTYETAEEPISVSPLESRTMQSESYSYSYSESYSESESESAAAPLEVPTPPTVDAKKPKTNPPAASVANWQMQEQYQPFVEAYREAKPDVIDEDFAEAAPGFRVLDFEQQQQAIDGVRARVAAGIWPGDKPHMVMRPANFIAKREWKRPVIAPVARAPDRSSKGGGKSVAADILATIEARKARKTLANIEAQKGQQRQ